MNFTQKIKLVWEDNSLKKKILFIFAAILIFRLLAIIPVPGIDADKLEELISGSELLSMVNLFSGSGFSSLSLVMLGVGPYITASIAMQLLTTVFPKLKEMYHEQGDAGRRKFAQISRVISIPLAFIQGIGFMVFLTNQGIVGNIGLEGLIMNALLITAGSALLMWVGELVSEFGIGNGVSLIIFAGIVSKLPGALKHLADAYDPTMLLTYIAVAVAMLLVILGVVFISEAERSIPVTYAKQAVAGKLAGGISTYVPIRINQAGVMPIIFAMSFLLFPQLLAAGFGMMQKAQVGKIDWTPAVDAMNSAVEFLNGGVAYVILYAVLVFLFTYFYTAITFDPEAMAENLQKSGAFIPGVRPGKATEEHIATIVTRLTFIGAVFLAVVAVLPVIVQHISGIQRLAIGGTGLLIVVSVVIDILKKLDSQVSMREY